MFRDIGAIFLILAILAVPFYIAIHGFSEDSTESPQAPVVKTEGFPNYTTICGSPGIRLFYSNGNGYGSIAAANDKECK